MLKNRFEKPQKKIRKNWRKFVGYVFVTKLMGTSEIKLDGH
jgi:hypothetical protein